jgi:ribonuclease HII
VEEIICSYWEFGLKVKPMDGGRLESGASKGLVFSPFEADALMQGFHAVAGIDEVGRGPLAGPVVAAAVILPRGFTHPEVKDSKMLSSKQREKLALIIQQAAQSWALGVIDVDGIDRLNILCASLTAMALALECLTPKPDYVLIDGNQKIPLEFFAEVGSNSAHQPLSQQTIVKGDQLCLSIAAASIVAKVARDQMMVDFDKQYPEYGFAGHKGYASAAHLAALQRYGPTPIHRRSFKPVRDLLIIA